MSDLQTILLRTVDATSVGKLRAYAILLSTAVTVLMAHPLLRRLLIYSQRNRKTYTLA
jgi:hypothetical protein